MGQNDLGRVLKIIQRIRLQGSESEQTKMRTISNMVMQRMSQTPTQESQLQVHWFCKAFLRQQWVQPKPTCRAMLTIMRRSYRNQLVEVKRLLECLARNNIQPNSLLLLQV